MKLSVSSYSYRQLIRAGKMTQLDVIAKAAEMGFDGVEFTDLHPFEGATQADQIAYAKQIRAAAEAAGIEIVAYTVGANLYQGSEEADDREVARLKGQVEVAAALGTKLMRHDVCSSERVNGRVVSFASMLPTLAANVRRVTEYAVTLGIRTCSENHGFVAQDSDRVAALYNAVGHENYGLLVDIGNFACVDESSAYAVSRLAPYAFLVHAKDFRVRPYHAHPAEGEKYITTRGCNYLFACAVGEGDIPVEQCVAILKRAGYDGYLSIEYEGVEDCIAGITRGRNNLKHYIE
ncbi:MAG: sugar phosphate isomerase/epimerase [Ruminococcaceae bacterium]|nr:sugar phosphate isomerase/epimerase [Oscillospiraceae bacterium]